jgi:PKD repeat protein
MYRSSLLLSLLILVLTQGCAGGGVSTTMPATGSAPTHDITAQGVNVANVGCWGIWDVAFDPSTGTATVIPIRGAQFIANVTMFLQPPAGSTAFLKFQNIEFDFDSFPGYVEVNCDIGLTHPFPGLDQYTGFDVRGVFMHDGELTSDVDSGIKFAGPDSARLLNADSHTRWMNATEFTKVGVLGYTPGKLGNLDFVPGATLNPCKYFCDGLGVDDDAAGFFADPFNQSERGCFRPGSTNFRHYQLLWPDGPLKFQYAVIASYEKPNHIPPESIPGDFPINANCPEPFLVTVADDGSTAFYEGPDSQGGDLHLELEIYDWGVLEHSGGITGEIGSIDIESPGSLIPVPLTFDPADLPVDPGISVSSVYHVDIPGVVPSGLTGQTVLCRVTSAMPDNYDSGFGADYPEDAVLAAYLVFDAPISPVGGELPVAVAKTCDCLWIAPGESIIFDGTDSYSPNGPITDWEWDFDGDGTYGDAHGGTPDIPIAVFPDEGTYYVDLKVTDIAGKTDTLDPDEILDVHVGYWTSPPTAVSKICPTIGFTGFDGDFIGSGSLGTINLYEWDFEGDCIWDYQHPTIGDTTHAYDIAGYYDPVLRVTGEGCDSISTSVRMIEPLGILENGNFWDGVTWDPWEHGHWTKPGPPVEEIIPDPVLVPGYDFKNIVRFYVPPTSDGNCTWIIQDVDYDVSGLDELYFNFFFYIDYNTLTGDGWLAGDTDFHIHIAYEDENGMWNGEHYYEMWFGYDTSYDGTWQWDYYQPPPWTMPEWVTYHNTPEVVPEDTWNERKTINLMSVPDHKPVTIKEVWVTCRGWSWQTYTTLPWFSIE